MGRLLGAPGHADGADCPSTDTDEVQADPLLAAIKELTRFADDSSAPQRVRRTIARFVQEKPDLLFELAVSPYDITDLDDCILSFGASMITNELLNAVHAEDWEGILAVGRKYLD